MDRRDGRAAAGHARRPGDVHRAIAHLATCTFRTHKHRARRAQHFTEHGVALSPGAEFGGTVGYGRLNFACPRATLVRGLERIRAALDAARGARGGVRSDCAANKSVETVRKG